MTAPRILEQETQQALDWMCDQSDLPHWQAERMLPNEAAVMAEIRLEYAAGLPAIPDEYQAIADWLTQFRKSTASFSNRYGEWLTDHEQWQVAPHPTDPDRCLLRHTTDGREPTTVGAPAHIAALALGKDGLRSILSHHTDRYACVQQILQDTGHELCRYPAGYRTEEDRAIDAYAAQAAATGATCLAVRIEWPPWPERRTTWAQIYDNRPGTDTGYVVTHIRLADRIPDQAAQDLPQLLVRHAPLLMDRDDAYSVHHPDPGLPDGVRSLPIGRYGLISAYRAITDLTAPAQPDAAQAYESIRRFLDHWVTRDDRSDGGDSSRLTEAAWELTQATYPAAVHDANRTAWAIAHARFPGTMYPTPIGEDPNQVSSMDTASRQAYYRERYGEDRIAEFKTAVVEGIRSAITRHGARTALDTLQNLAQAVTGKHPMPEALLQERMADRYPDVDPTAVINDDSIEGTMARFYAHRWREQNRLTNAMPGPEHYPVLNLLADRQLELLRPMPPYERTLLVRDAWRQARRDLLQMQIAHAATVQQAHGLTGIATTPWPPSQRTEPDFSVH